MSGSRLGFALGAPEALRSASGSRLGFALGAPEALRSACAGCRRGLLLWLVAQSFAGCSAVTTVDLLPQRRDEAAGNAGASSRSDAGASAGAGSSSGEASGAAGAFAGLALVNRYEFSGTGTQVVDSISSMHGEAMGEASLNGTGQLTLSGDPQTYVKLPSWLLSSMTSASIVIWFTWHGGRAWQSVFNFGANASNTAAPSEDVKAEFFFTPLMIPGPGSSLHVDMVYGDTIDFINDAGAFPIDTPSVIAAVFDAEAKQISLYINGVAVNSPKPTNQRLSELKDANCWLGQSQWAHDVANSGNLRGTFDEVRIYRGALSAQQVQSLVMTDPNAI